MKVSDHFENWDNFTNKCSVSLHAVDGNGTILWANNPELEFMGYDVEKTGFHIFLSPRISKFIESNIAGEMERMLGQAGLSICDVGDWLFHPGGSRVLKSIEKGLRIDPAKLGESTGVLRDYGNLSSATIYFIIDSFMRGASEKRGSYQVVGAVGPGFGLDAILTQWK